MNYTASPALCEELYELTHWLVTDDSGRYPAHYGGLDEKENPVYEPDVPAYELWYLLRNLPPRTSVYRGLNYVTARYEGVNRSIKVRLRSAEDAAAKLAIELIKDGVLKP